MEPTEENRRAWDELQRRRAEQAPGRPGIPEHVRERLPDVHGRHVLHLQCGRGEETAELAERGAFVTGVDVSEQALTAARERWPDIAWVRADVHALPVELRRGRFDLVYTGGGALASLHDPDAWAAGIHTALRPGGFLLLWDEHPVLACLDDFLHWRADYFGRPAGVGRIVTALAQAGLVIRRAEELPALTPWRRTDDRVPGELVLVAARR
jgi:SAM-dependent methyltransferase